MKAWRVSNVYEENAVIVFHTSNAAARRLGADAMNEGFDDVTCERDPEFDQYAPGPVPWRVLIEKHGWWHTCCNFTCDHRVSLDETRENDDGEEVEIIPVYDDADRVFCSQECHDQFHAEVRRIQEAKERASNAAKAMWSGITIKDVYLEPKAGRGVVSFTFPGGQHKVVWVEDNDQVDLYVEDQQAWREYITTLPEGPA